MREKLNGFINMSNDVRHISSEKIALNPYLEIYTTKKDIE